MLVSGLPAAAAFGRICAVAAAGQRDLSECAASRPELFPANPFDGALFGAVTLANAFCAPGLDADQLRIANRTTLWAFGVDWLIDYRAVSRLEVQEVVDGCLAVADGVTPTPDHPITLFLADIRDELAGVPGYAMLHPVWREELRLMLEAMAREWEWKAARDKESVLPSLDDYLNNADNHGSTFVNMSHWVFSESLESADGLERVLTASRAAQRVLRLLNDLATYPRDVAWGDLNALMLGVDQAEVLRRLGVLLEHCHAELDLLGSVRPRLAEFIERQVGFCMGFYEMADYWGTLQ
ncbi:MAG TPA: terpene synthase family protein [Kribbellaceae bacterium]|nr:terpene synthase family protein [Kribbellaceae bacterium]